jgi:hypothetical protein
MNKRILQLFMVLMFAVQGVMAQTVEMPDVTQPPGEFLMPVNTSGFATNVSAVTLIIGYDADVLSFGGILNTAIPGNWSANYNNTTKKLMIQYYCTNAGVGYPISGKLLDIKFNYLGGFPTNVTFASGCEFTGSNLQPIPNITYENGSVSQTAATGFVSLATEAAAPGSNVLVGLSMSGAGFTDVRSLTYKIAYDPAKLTFSQVVNSTLGNTLSASAANGVLTINWTGIASKDLSVLSKVFDIKFVYNGLGNVPVEFKGGCQVSNSALSLIPVSYSNGAVNEDLGTTTLALADVTGAYGSVVTVPLTLGPIFGGGYLGSLSLNIAYDANIMDFNGVNPGFITNGIYATASNGVVHINWSNSTNTTVLTGILMSLKFKYNGAGNSALTFVSGCVLTRTNLSNVTVAYTNGSIGQAGPYEGKVEIGDETANVGDAVTVDLAFSLFSTAAKTLTFNIQYDPTRLTYTGFASSIAGLSANATGGVVNIAWTGASAILLNGSTLQLNFVYNGGGDGDLNFIGGTQIKDASMVILNTQYVNGTVSTTTAAATIVTQPVDYTADLEGSMYFDIVATGASSYQWEFSIDGGTTWSPIPVITANTPNFTYGPIIGYTFYNGMKIRCLLMPGNVYSDEVTLTMNPLTVNAKVFLQGAYMYCMPTMCTELYNNSVLPTTQPYNVAPWNYAGTEEWTDPLPTNAVDWVLVELRSDINDADFITQKAGMLLSDGSIVDTDGGLLKFPGYDMDFYYVVITHRNHLPIMTASDILLQSQSVLYDFTTSDSQSYFDAGIGGTPLADNGDGTWSMFAGDGNGDGFVDVIDLVDIYFVEVDTDGYLSGDWNLDQYCDVNDLVDVYFMNVDIMSHVPLY